MPDNNWLNEIPSVDKLEDRFYFIEDDELKSNLTICFQYIIFLVTVDIEVNASGPVRYSLYRDVVIHTAAIIESSLHYCLKRLIDKGAVRSSDIMPSSWEFKNPMTIHVISSDFHIVGAEKRKVVMQLRDNTQMKDIIKAAVNAEVLSEDLKDKADDIRDKRNAIHLAGKDSEEIYPEKDQIDEMFMHAKEILGAIEAKLS